MKEQKKNTMKKNKIIRYDFSDEPLLDPKMDEVLKESFKKEADALEEKLNSDSALDDMELPDDFFQSIVGKLEEEGVWEENKDEMSENAAEAGMDNMDIYDRLSEEDREALRLGRKLQEKQQNRRVQRRKRGKVLRRVGIVAAIAVVIFGLSMTSEANRRLMLKAWDVMNANFNFRVQTNNTGEDSSVRSKSREEIAAMEEISNKMGIAAIDFGYMPEGMVYDSYEIIGDNLEALLFYRYQDAVISIRLIHIDEEGSAYYAVQGDSIFVETMTNVQNIEAKLWETSREQAENERSYIADMEYNGGRYLITGKLLLEEMKKIIKYSYFL